MRILTLLPVLGLAACVTGPANPERVSLDLDMLTVTMSDRSVCRGPAPLVVRETGWSGRLEGCPWTYAYRVELDPSSNPVRMVLEEVFVAVGLDDILRPSARVTIVDATGRERVFEQP